MADVALSANRLRLTSWASASAVLMVGVMLITGIGLVIPADLGLAALGLALVVWAISVALAVRKQRLLGIQCLGSGVLIFPVAVIYGAWISRCAFEAGCV
jgi:hypothetical protein